VFTANGSGTGPGLILNQNSSANSSTNPALKGSQIIIYATGDGDATSGMAAGSLVTRSIARPPTVSVTIGGVPAEVTYAGTAPGLYAGMLQMNVRIPVDAPSGDVPLMVNIAGATSQPGVTVAVK
jgi:uncharacterized protein (TIGR03437 family)